MSLQRRRGTAIRLWGTNQVTDKRGNTMTAMDPDSAWDTKGWVIPQRSQKAEVPGQVQINVITVGIPVPTVEMDVNVWAHAEYDGKQWDTVSPPAYHHGTRLTRHWTIELRERPS